MSVLSPECPTASDSVLVLEDAPPAPLPSTLRQAGFKRPVAPGYDQSRDNELISRYFDGSWTTKDIADHFKVTVAAVAAWFQRPDIVAIIDFIAAANERRARDIARENLPGTIDILHRISRVRNSDAAAREASCTLVRFARGQAAAATRSNKPSTSAKTVQSTISDRVPDMGAAVHVRGAGVRVSRDMHPVDTVEQPYDKRAASDGSPFPGGQLDVPRSLPNAPSDPDSKGWPPSDQSSEPVPLHSSRRVLLPTAAAMQCAWVNCRQGEREISAKRFHTMCHEPHRVQQTLSLAACV